jgi:hypothetical protein
MEVFSRKTSIQSKKSLKVMKRIRLVMRMKSSRCTLPLLDLKECKLEMPISLPQLLRMNLNHLLRRKKRKRKKKKLSRRKKNLLLNQLPQVLRSQPLDHQEFPQLMKIKQTADLPRDRRLITMNKLPNSLKLQDRR